MESTYIYEGTLAVNYDLGKVYLVNSKVNSTVLTVLDLNESLLKFLGEKVKVVVAKAENI